MGRPRAEGAEGVINSDRKLGLPKVPPSGVHGRRRRRTLMPPPLPDPPGGADVLEAPKARKKILV